MQRAVAQRDRELVITHVNESSLKLAIETLFVADEAESTQYCKAQQESEWQDVKFIVSAPGIKDLSLIHI